jgi:hypothetical protein
LYVRIFQQIVLQVGDLIDARDPTMGAWFEANIVEVIKDKNFGLAQTRRHATTSSINSPEEAAATTSQESSTTATDGENKNVVATDKADSDSEDSGMQVDNNNDETKPCDEVDGTAVQNVKNIEQSTVLSPKKINTSKDNSVADASTSGTSRSLFKKDVSDDLKKKGILCETDVSDGFIYKVTFDG